VHEAVTAADRPPRRAPDGLHVRLIELARGPGRAQCHHQFVEQDLRAWPHFHNGFQQIFSEGRIAVNIDLDETCGYFDCNDSRSAFACSHR
jgi:hypothetical protein